MRAAAAMLGLLVGRAAQAQFVDPFDTVAIDPSGKKGWRLATGDGKATLRLLPGGPGHASLRVDASRDRRGIWWALIEREVSGGMDLRRLSQPGQEVRIEARVRVSHAPRRVNLQMLTDRTTDYHAHLMEYDLPDTGRWHTISMTTRGFEVAPGETVIGHLALMDWGLDKYRVDVDYIKVDIVDVARAGPDHGAAVPYHPPVADPARFAVALPVAHDAMIDRDSPQVNLNDWSVRDGSRTLRVLTVDGTRDLILRWDLASLTGRRVAGHGLLELTTHSVQRKGAAMKDFGLLRAVEILGGEPRWDQNTVTAQSFCRGQPLSRVFNPQMIIDWPASEADGKKTYLTISRPVLQRLIDGQTRGIAVRPLGALSASFYASEQDAGKNAPRLLLNLAP
jgi:hypothetical protein